MSQAARERQYYPVALDVTGRPCVVIGGGPLAEQKVLGLRDAGAHVTVVSPALTPALEELARQRQIDVHRREYRWGDLEHAWLAIAAGEDRAINPAVWAEAEERSIPLNAVDDIPRCSFIAPAIHREGSITITVSTAGKSPALAVQLRKRIARIVHREDGRLLDLLGELRPHIAARVPDSKVRAELWHDIVESDVIDYVRRDDRAGARARIEELLQAALGTTVVETAVRSTPGVVYLVGAGPGDPGLLTIRGRDVLQSADAIVYDRLVPQALVDFGRDSAERFFVGKHPDDGGVSQERISELLVELARKHAVVVRLKGGDPFVFGRGAEEAEALHDAGVPFAVVPGVSAAIAAPASAGIPVTHREYASGFAVITGHECEGESDLDWEALARIPTLVVLMGLKHLDAIAARLQDAGRAGETPAAVVAQGTLRDERVVVATLATIAAEAALAGLESPATLVVGDVVRVRERIVAVAALSAGGNP